MLHKCDFVTLTGIKKTRFINFSENPVVFNNKKPFIHRYFNIFTTEYAVLA
jgi:hypothetical protein